METISLTISKSQDTATDCNAVTEVSTDEHENNKKDREICAEELEYGTASATVHISNTSDYIARTIRKRNGKQKSLLGLGELGMGDGKY